MQKDFGKPNTVRNHHAFELVDLVVASLPFSFAGKTLHPFNQNAAIPGAIENDNLPRVGELFLKALQIVPAALVR